MARLCFLLAALLTACAGTEKEETRPPAPEPPLGKAGKKQKPAEAIEEYLQKYGYDAADFEPAVDRWRIGLPRWDRVKDKRGYDSPFETGAGLDPYNQNVWKGDYPIWGQNTFFVFTAVSDTVIEARKLPTPAGVSTALPGQFDFFGAGDQLFFTTNLILSFELFKGNTAFKPVDWLVRLTPVFNLNHLDVKENNNVNVNPGEGTTRTDGHVALQEAFIEKHLFDLSENYDFVSATVGIQPFVADFRGLLFVDSNLAARVTLNADNNRWQANLAVFYQLEKDTNSGLNTLDARDQILVFANFFRQDFVFFGYTISGLLAYNHDKASVEIDTNGFPVRPPVAGDPRPHDLDVFYLGFSGDGHMGRLNITHEYFYAFGEDSHNPLAGEPIDISAHMFFIEASVDVDWWRPRFSFLWASGDDDPNDGTGRGFDAILDNPTLGGGLNSYWNRQGLRLLGVGLVQPFSVYPTLRSSKNQGQANFVNPGLFLFNIGVDAELTQEVRASLNVTYMMFADTSSLESFANQNDIDRALGFEVTLSGIYRPLLTNNVIVASGLSVFLPGAGFEDLYEDQGTLFSLFVQLTLVY